MCTTTTTIFGAFDLCVDLAQFPAERVSLISGLINVTEFGDQADVFCVFDFLIFNLVCVCECVEFVEMFVVYSNCCLHLYLSLC